MAGVWGRNGEEDRETEPRHHLERGARRRFDADLEQQLEAARRLDRKIEGATTELKKAANRLQRILDGRQGRRDDEL